jgi:antirestriction protein ArdC
MVMYDTPYAPTSVSVSPFARVRKGEHRTTVVYADRFPHEEKRRARESGDDPAATSRRRP